MVVSRVGKEHDVGSQITKQVFSSPRSLAVVAGVLGVLGSIPGMPHLVFLLIAGGPRLRRLDLLRSAPEARQERAEGAPAPLEANAEATWDDLQPVDTLGLEVGYRLIALVDKARHGDLLARIKGVRASSRRTSASCRRRCTSATTSSSSRARLPLTLRGAVVGEGEAYPGMWLAINPGGASTPLLGTATTDPAFGLPATWIEERQRERRRWPVSRSLIARPWSRPTSHT
jgi:flagellar biosynthesis protein FlhA